MDTLKMSGPTCGLRTDADTPKGVCPQCPRPQVPPEGGRRGQFADMSTMSAVSTVSAVSAERMLAAMGEENERQRYWFKASPYDANGNLTIRSILTGETETIRLSKRRRWQ
jgi:hypothetical protein